MFSLSKGRRFRILEKVLKINSSGISFAHSASELASKALETSHCHDDYEILFIVDGRGQYVIEGTEFSVTPGVLLLARPLEYHCIKISAGYPYERYVINFTSDSVLPEAEEVFKNIITKGSSSRAYSSLGFSESIMSVFSRFAIAQSLADDRREPYMRLLLSELIMILSVSAEELRASDDGELGARVIKYLNENIDKNVSLEKIAKHFFVSKYYLCRAFKKHNGISVHGYINRKRVMLAKQLIESGETASGAAYRVGFCDYSAFYRAYMKVLGEAPTANIKSQTIGEEATANGAV